MPICVQKFRIDILVPMHKNDKITKTVDTFPYLKIYKNAFAGMGKLIITRF